VQRLVGELDSALGAALEGRPNDGDTDAYRDTAAVFPLDAKVFNRCAKLLGDFGRKVTRQVEQDHGELLTAVASSKVQRPLCKAIYDACNALQGFVTGLVPVQIV